MCRTAGRTANAFNAMVAGTVDISDTDFTVGFFDLIQVCCRLAHRINAVSALAVYIFFTDTAISCARFTYIAFINTYFITMAADALVIRRTRLAV